MYEQTPLPHLESEHTFIQELQQRSERAFRTLVESYQGRVYNTCLGFLKDPAEADDMSQEVFVEVYEKIASFKEEARLSTWLYKIAVNKCLERIRYQKRKKRWALLSSLWNAQNELTVHEPPDFFHPGVALENKERAAILMDKVAALPESQRTAFTLHKLEGLTYDEIATVMDVSVPAVESLLVRAKANLRKSLRKYYEDL